MTAFFMDTSAIVKRYVAEIGSNWVTSLTAPETDNIIMISRLTTVEVCSVLARLQRSNKLPSSDGTRLRADFLSHVDTQYLTITVDDEALGKARDLVPKYPLRTLDAIQLACALEAVTALGETLTFLCSDNDLLNAATGEGFTTDNPLMHP